MKDNLRLFALSWLERKHKTRHYQRENSCIVIYKMCNEKVIKRKIVNLQMKKKMSKAVEENILKIMITRF